MGCYFKLVNPMTRECIEPSRIGGQGIKQGAIVFGAAGRLFAYLHIWEDQGWLIVGDEHRGSDLYEDESIKDATEKWVAKFNEMYPEEAITMVKGVDT